MDERPEAATVPVQLQSQSGSECSRFSEFHELNTSVYKCLRINIYIYVCKEALTIMMRRGNFRYGQPNYSWGPT